MLVSPEWWCARSASVLQSLSKCQTTIVYLFCADTMYLPLELHAHFALLFKPRSL